MTADRWIPRGFVFAYVLVLAVLGGFTLIAFRTETGLVSDNAAPQTEFRVLVRTRPDRILVGATDMTGHPLTALSVRGVAVPASGGTPLPLRFEPAGDGQFAAAWTGIGPHRVELTLRHGATTRNVTAAMP